LPGKVSSSPTARLRAWHLCPPCVLRRGLAAQWRLAHPAATARSRDPLPRGSQGRGARYTAPSSRTPRRSASSGGISTRSRCTR
jgi:hypothetical protein